MKRPYHYTSAERWNIAPRASWRRSPALLEGDHASPHPSQYYLHHRAMVGTVRAVFGRFAKPKHPSS